MTGERYNGWKNRETWDVALWIRNDEGLYAYARDFSETGQGYIAFAEYMRELGVIETPDGVAYNDSGLDIEALDEMIRDLGE